MARERPWRDPDKLERLYWDEHRSLREVSDRLGTTPETVRKWLERHGLGTRSRAEAQWRRLSYVPLEQHPAGYEQWRTHIDDRDVRVSVHRLAAVAWFGYDAVAGGIVHHRMSVPWLNAEWNLEVFDSHADHAAHHGESDAPWRDADVLRELCIDRGLSTREAGDRLGCSDETVRRWLHRHGLW